ncbi:hypothetical protein GCM10011321_32190 [Youhaiella tibetensis]|uniref:Glycosyltransferase family 8 protein n=1 Tax=Paradevosia tibetensis TaxID=1447062 RepID=A0A5B9DIB3_9HYPH|nr:glycosyltransferase family 8 protein [Youhaiella tibetensis]QEE18827.1 glycosyltransferase family 8 protein [Youhaiella tibetensis]GGF38784.1 hypothetical protein GCM10011321_32190 [Youhaiella tibetensis]
MPDNKIHIALAFDDNFWAPAYAVMRSICLFTKRRSDLVFHLIHQPITDEHRADLEKIPAEFGATLVWHDLTRSDVFNAIVSRVPSSRQWTSVVYGRLLIDTLVGPDVSRVIYLDCDMMVRAPIEDLYAADLGEFPIGAVRDTAGALIVGGRDIKNNRDIFDPADPYFNSGMVVIDVDKWRQVAVPERLEELIASGVMARLYYDQDVLNLVFKHRWQPLPTRWNTIDARHPHEGLDPSILHYTGPNKPWNLVSNVAFRRIYRHVMTNELFYRFMRHRWSTYWRRKLGLRGRA